MLNQNMDDPESLASLKIMAEEESIRSKRLAQVRTVLVVLSSMGMVFDVESLRQKILLAYPQAVVFFRTTMGKDMGSSSPDKVDLLIDFTGPRERQGLMYARKLRRLARVAIGRNAGLFRKSIYDQVFDERRAGLSLPTDKLERERVVQREVLSLAGIAFVQAGDSAPDRGKITPLELPPLAKH
jgi:hypothetical protein